MKKFLIIDDDGQDPQAALELLREHGYTAAFSADYGESAGETGEWSKRQCRDFIDNAPVGIFRSTIDGKFIGVNPAAARILKYDSPEDLVETANRSSIAEVLYLDSAWRFEMIEDLLQHEGWRAYEVQYRCKDGSVITCNDYIRKVVGPDGIVAELEGFVEDMTERKRADVALRESEESLRIILENILDPVFLTDDDGRFTFICGNVAHILGYTVEEIQAMGSISKLLGNELFALDDLKTRGEIHNIDCGICNKDGSWRDYLVTVKRVSIKEGTILYVCRDITELKWTEGVMSARMRLLQFAETHTLDELLEATLDEAEALTGSLVGFYAFLEADQNTLSFQNWSTRTKKEFCTAEGKGLHYDISEAGVWVDCVYRRRPVIHNDYASLTHRKGLPPGHAPLVREMVVPVFRGKNITAILAVGNKPENYTTQDVETVSLLADLAWTIAERKRSEATLRESEEKFRVLAETSPTAIFLYQGEMIVYANPATELLFGYTRDELLQMRFWDWAHEDFRDLVKERGLSRQMGEAAPPRYESRFVTKTGEDRWLVVSAGLIEYHGRPAGIASFLDITESKRIEGQLRESLAEKVVLLKEVHHRVKNNLQIITSLLELQAYSIPDEKLRTYLRESQDRIRSMALIHEQLYKSKDFSFIDFGGYIRNLAQYLFDSYVADSVRISLEVDAGEIFLEIDRAIPCGLIINELISNAMKHAFPAERSGDISVRVSVGGGGINLAVSDTGVGMPPGLDLEHAETMGLQLVTMLVKQLRGKMWVEDARGGTAFFISFPRNNAE